MYNLSAYAQLIGDPVRIDAYVEALKRTVTPDSVVASPVISGVRSATTAVRALPTGNVFLGR